MRRALSVTARSVLLLACLGIAQEAATQTLTVTSPTGGENWTQGSSRLVTWTISGSTASINYQLVALSTNGGGTYTNISSALTPSARSFSWTVPSNISSNQVRIRVRAMDINAFIKAFGASNNNFTIAAASQPAPVITVSSPNGGESWTQGTGQTISWSISGDTSTLNYQLVAYSTDGGNNFANISAAMTPGTRSFNWTVPGGVTSSQVRVRVRAMDVNGVIRAEDASNSNFTISAPASTAPTISSVSPNPVTGSNVDQSVTIFGSNFVSKPAVTLTWTGQGGHTLPSVAVSYINSSELRMLITTGVLADNWTVRVTNPNGQSSTARAFSVVVPQVTGPSVSSVTPNSLTQGTGSPTVTIAGSGFSANTWHQLSVNGGSSWSWATATPNIVGSSSMTAPINTSVAQTIRIRVCASHGSSVCSGSVSVIVAPPATTSNNASQHVADLTIPDGTELQLAQSFIKVWRLKNTGTTTWGSGYTFRWNGGSQFGAQVSIAVPTTNPGSTADLSVPLVAPSTTGTHTSYWQLYAPNGQAFGARVFTQIKVVAPTADGAQFVQAVSHPDNTVVSSGQPFTAVRRLRNTGTRPWTSGYVLKWTGGPQLGTSNNVPASPASAGNTLDVSVPMVAPTTAGTFTSYWQMHNSSGQPFGDRVHVQIQVSSGSTDGVEFVSDVTHPPTADVPAGSIFLKIWKVRNTGTTTWNSGYTLRWNGGTQLGNPVHVPLSSTAPGVTRDISASMVAPTTAGTYSSQWQLYTPNGQPFGPRLTVQIRVPTSSAVDKAAFVTDVTIPDGTEMSPGEKFSKIWRLRNTGDTQWTNAYRFAYVDGPKMSAPNSITVSTTAATRTWDAAVAMTAPSAPGTYQGWWQLRNAQGTAFGPRVYVSIVVKAPTSPCDAAHLAQQLQIRLREGAEARIAGYMPDVYGWTHNVVNFVGTVSSAFDGNLRFGSLRSRYDFLYYSATAHNYAAHRQYILAERARKLGKLPAACALWTEGLRLDVSAGELHTAAANTWNKGADVAEFVIERVFEGACISAQAVSTILNPLHGGTMASQACIWVEFAVEWIVNGKPNVGGLLADQLKAYLIGKLLAYPPIKNAIDSAAKGLLSQKMLSKQLVGHVKGAILQPSFKNELTTGLRQLGITATNAALDDLVTELINELLDALFEHELFDARMEAGQTAAVDPGAPLAVVSSPALGAIDVSTDFGQVTIGLTEAVVATGSARLKSASGTVDLGVGTTVGTTVSWSVPGALAAGTDFTVVIPEASLVGSKGQPLPPLTWTFTTKSASIKADALVSVQNSGETGVVIRAEPGRGANAIATVQDDTKGLIVDGPSIAAGEVWWKVQTSAGTGWIPILEALTPVDRFGLRAGGRARVVSVASSGVSIHAAPGVDAPVAALVPVGTEVEVLGGPLLLAGYSWWQVRSNGTDGYVATGDWLVPYGSAPAACLTKTNALSASQLSFESLGGEGQLVLTMAAECRTATWEALRSYDWIEFTGPSSGVGDGVIAFRVRPNPFNEARTGEVSVGGQLVTMTQEAGSSSCAYSIAPPSISIGPAEASGHVRVTTDAGCPWSAVSNSAFITIDSAATGAGSGLVAFTVLANQTATEKTGTATIAGQTVTVTQGTSTCSYTINPQSIDLGNVGDVGQIQVTTEPWCEWSAQSHDTALTFPAGSGGKGNGRIPFTIATNMTTSPHVATATIAGKTFTITQRALDAGALQRNRARSDFDGDGHADLLWQQQTHGLLAFWALDGSLNAKEAHALELSVEDLNWRIVGTADFNGDLKPDIVWHHRERGEIYVWYMDGPRRIGHSGFSIDGMTNPAWRIAGVGDFNGDGKPDLIWQHDVIGWLVVWLMHDTMFLGGAELSPASVDAEWKIAGVADFDGDNKSDLLLRNERTGGLGLWLMDGLTRRQTLNLDPNVVEDLEWHVAAVIDINGDGATDLVWQHQTHGIVAVWYMHGAQRLGYGVYPIPIDTEWKIVGPARQDTSACTYSITPSSIGVGGSSTEGALQVRTQPGCAWSATDSGFISFQNGGGRSGPGRLVFNVATNASTASRSGAAIVAGQTFTVTQSGQACVFTLNPSQVDLGNMGDSGQIQVLTQPWCQWSATSNDAFITLPGLTGAMGTGRVPFTVSTNMTTLARTGTITVAGRPVTITQRALDAERRRRNRARADFDGDGHTDLLWQEQTQGYLAFWSLQGGHDAKEAHTMELAVDDLNWRIVGTGDFNGDDKPDILWQNREHGRIYVWFMDGTRRIGDSAFSVFGMSNPDWRIAGIGDFNGDGKADLVWQHDSVGWLVVWLMDGTTYLGGIEMSPNRIDAEWKIAGVADFDGDGHSDLLWRNAHTGGLGLWLMDGVTRRQYLPLDPQVVDDFDWHIASVTDINGDGAPDLVWQHQTNGAIVVWYMNGAGRIGYGTFPWAIDTTWKIVGPR